MIYFFRGGVTRGRTHSDLDTIIGEDEGRVGRGELGVRHCDWFGRLRLEVVFADGECDLQRSSQYGIARSSTESKFGRAFKT